MASPYSTAVPPLIPGESTVAFGAVTKELKVYGNMNASGDVTILSSGSLSVAGSTILVGVSMSNLTVSTITAGALNVSGGRTVLANTTVTNLSASGVTTGTLTVTSGTTLANVTTSNLIVSGLMYRSEAVNKQQGINTLVAGFVGISNTAVTANSRIFLTNQSLGGPTAGSLYVSGRSAGNSFTIGSSAISDTSVVAYEIFEPSS